MLYLPKIRQIIWSYYGTRKIIYKKTLLGSLILLVFLGALCFPFQNAFSTVSGNDSDAAKKGREILDSKGKFYKIIYYPNGGSGTMEPQNGIAKITFEKNPLKENEFTSPNPFLVFDCWESNGNDYAPNTVLSEDSDVSKTCVDTNRKTAYFEIYMNAKWKLNMPLIGCCVGGVILLAGCTCLIIYLCRRNTKKTHEKETASDTQQDSASPSLKNENTEKKCSSDEEEKEESNKTKAENIEAETLSESLSYCRECGKPLAQNSKFCTKCGTKVEVD